MNVGQVNRIFCYALALAMLANGQYAYAETRRALLIGIDKYVSGKAPSGQTGPTIMTLAASGRGDWSDLDGAVNDVDVLQQILTARYGFKPEDIRVLRNFEATRDRILSETKTWLIDAAAPGDVSFFFYAGHGSQVKNSRTEEADGLDESIVPSDANKGAPDIRDKELAGVFGGAVDKKLRLTVIFDSCHSGFDRSRRAEADPFSIPAAGQSRRRRLFPTGSARESRRAGPQRGAGL